MAQSDRPSGAVKTALKSDKMIIVIKVGTSSLVRPEHQTLNLKTLASACETVKELSALGHHVIVITSGATGVGCQRMNLDQRPAQLAKKQALAAVGQVHLMRYYEDFFNSLGLTCAQVLLTLDNLASRHQYVNATNTFTELLAYGTIPVVNENDTVAVARRGFGDNDTLSAQVATLVQADYLFLLTDVDSLYEENPKTNPDAQPIYEVEDISALTADTSTAGTQWGTGGMATKITAARIATAAGVTTVICNSNTPENILRVRRAPAISIWLLGQQYDVALPLLGCHLSPLVLISIACLDTCDLQACNSEQRHLHMTSQHRCRCDLWSVVFVFCRYMYNGYAGNVPCLLLMSFNYCTLRSDSSQLWKTTSGACIGIFSCNKRTFVHASPTAVPRKCGLTLDRSCSQRSCNKEASTAHGLVVQVIEGEPNLGTRFHPLQNVLRGRRRWIVSVPVQGQIWLNLQTVRNVKDKHRSLFTTGKRLAASDQLFVASVVFWGELLPVQPCNLVSVCRSSYRQEARPLT